MLTTLRTKTDPDSILSPRRLNGQAPSVLSIPKFTRYRYRDQANFGIGTLGSIGARVSLGCDARVIII